MTKNLFTLLALVLVPCIAALADPITIDLDSSLLSGSAGDELQFFGTLTNTGSDTVFLNFDNFNLTGLPLSSIDDSPFFLNAPLSLDPGDNSGDIELFDINIPDPVTPGDYTGTFQVLGGADADAQIIVGSADFTVDVPGPVSTVPEPSSLVVLSAAFLGLGWLRRHRRP